MASVVTQLPPFDPDATIGVSVAPRWKTWVSDFSTYLVPSHAWNEVKIDFCGPFPSGHYVLVVIDIYSRYPEIEILKSTAAPKVIPKLDITFARHGIPEKVTTDNGPPFNRATSSKHI